jgi:hypothetical protein
MGLIRIIFVWITQLAIRTSAQMPPSWLGVDLEASGPDDPMFTIAGDPNPLTQMCLNSGHAYYSARREALVSACETFGEVCDLGADHRSSGDPARASPWSGALKHIDCAAVWTDVQDLEDPFEWPPPVLPPCPLAEDFTMQGEAGLRHNHFVERDLGSTPATSDSAVWSFELIESMVADATQGTLHERYHAEAGSEGDPFSKVLEGLRFLNVTGKSVLVIGSTSPWVKDDENGFVLLFDLTNSKNVTPFHAWSRLNLTFDLILLSLVTRVCFKDGADCPSCS